MWDVAARAGEVTFMAEAAFSRVRPWAFISSKDGCAGSRFLGGRGRRSVRGFFLGGGSGCLALILALFASRSWARADAGGGWGFGR